MRAPTAETHPQSFSRIKKKVSFLFWRRSEIGRREQDFVFLLH